jgi:hypothetical protein
VQALGHELRVHGFGLVLEVDDLADPPDGDLDDWPAAVGHDLALGGGDRIAVRIEPWLAEVGRQPPGALLRRFVLEHFGRSVPLRRRETGLVREVALPQAMNADDPERLAPAPAREPRVRPLVLDEREPLQASEQLARSIPREPERAGEALERDRLLARLEVVEVFERVLEQDSLSRAQAARESRPQPAARPERDGKDRRGGRRDQKRRGGVHRRRRARRRGRWSDHNALSDFK